MTYKEASIEIKKPVSSVDGLDPVARKIAADAMRAVDDWERREMPLAVRSDGPCSRICANARAIISGERHTPIQVGLEYSQKVAADCLEIVASWDETAGYADAPMPDDEDVPVGHRYGAGLAAAGR